MHEICKIQYKAGSIMNNEITANPTIRIIAGSSSWIEGAAVQQLEQTAKLPGISHAIGMPDIHPGKGYPIGAAFLSNGCIYPYLVGNDIGCGMGLWQTSLSSKKIKKDRWVKKLTAQDGPWDGDIAFLLDQAGVTPTQFDRSLGTIGTGNHFAELQIVETIENPELFNAIGLDKNQLNLLVHSGSRGVGEAILRKHIDQFRDQGLEAESPAAKEYLDQHDNAIRWAEANRGLIAQRFLSSLGADGNQVLDSCHNSIQKVEFSGFSGFIHRKGAVPATGGAVLVPGSRGDLTYLVQPIHSSVESGFSLAHGAGRKWNRGEAKQRMRARFKVSDLTHTQSGGYVICEDRDLLFEEAPEVYKKVGQVVQDMVDAGLARVIATFRPLITYKIRKMAR
jgi:release factor H-coupled RctB family protein